MQTNTPRCVVVRKEEIEKMLLLDRPDGKNVIEPFRTYARENGLPFNVLEDKNTQNLAEIHKTLGDLWLCLEGEAVFTYGGELVDPWVKEKDGQRFENELLAKEIKGGMETTLKPGDWLWIPMGVAHQHVCNGIARFVVVKIPISE